MRVAVAQLDAEPLDPEGNAERGVRAIEAAADEGAALVVLPELFLSGYVVREAVAGAAEPGDGSGPGLARWREAARRRSVAVVGGFCERSGDGRLYNSVAAIDAAGAVCGVYRKLHLFDRERDVYAAGDRGLLLVELGGVRIGVLVCYDLRFPEAMRILALRGAELVAVPTAWVDTFNEGRQTLSGAPGQVEAAVVQAALNQVFVAVADRVGVDEGLSFLGRSLVVSPYGEPLAGPLDPAAEALAVVELDPQDARRARLRAGRIDVRADRRTDVYDDLLGYAGG